MATEEQQKRLVVDEDLKVGQKEKQKPGNKRPRIKSKHTDPVVLEVRRNIQQCCATNDLAKALDVYHDALERSIRIEAQTFYNLLNLCDGLDRTKVHIGTPKPNNDDKNEEKSEEPEAPIRDVDLNTRKEAAFEIKGRMDEQKIPLNETAYTALVKILSRAKEVELADSIIAEAEQTQQCRVKLRLYSALLTTYCEIGKLLPALKLWERLHLHDLSLGEKEYATLIDCCANTGHADVMQKVLSDLAEDVLVPSRDTCRSIVRWFQSSYAHASASDDKDAASASLLEQVTLPSQIGASLMGSLQCKEGEQWRISEVCHIDTSTGILKDGCMRDLALKPVRVSLVTWDEMLTMNEKIVLAGKLDNDNSEFQGGRKGKKRKIGGSDQDERVSRWNDFKDYLKQRGNDFDIIIDGANVGYFKKNFAGAPKHVDYYQIDSVVRHFLRENKKVLLVLHQRHFAHFMMPKRFQPLVKSWEDVGVLYKTPAGMNDDWFWLHAALVSGTQTLVVTNDEMRDHHFQMLAPRSFLRWKERHQVHFGFGAAEYDETRKSNGRSVILTYPDIYSRRIQQLEDGFVIPHPKQGDENRFLDGVHVADADIAAAEETYLCVRPVAVKVSNSNTRKS